MSARAGEIRGAAASFALPIEGLRLLGRERRLWSMALIPLLISVLAFSAALGAVVSYAGEIQGLVGGWLPVLEAGAWYSWLWIGPAKLLLWLVGKLLFLAVAMTCVVAVYLVASLLASPFHAALSRRVELVATGRVEELDEPGVLAILREGGRAAREELRRLVFFLGVWLLLAILGLLVPGGQVVAPPLMTLFTLFFLPLDYASYTLDRRRLSFRQKRQWLLAHAGSTLAFGLAAFLVCAIPLLNLLAMPVLVVSGTLLALRHGPELPGGVRNGA